MLISDSKYLAWQKKLAANSAFRYFWIFWGVYSVLIYACIAIYLLTWHQGWKIVILAAIAAFFNRYVICELIVHFYKKQHPYQKLGFDVSTSRLFSLKDGRPDSWPSQHVSTSVAIATVICFYSLPLGVLALATALVMGAGRIILGYHYLADVLGGWLIGIISAVIIIHLLAPIIIK